MQDNISEKNFKELEIEFNKLTSINEKYDFWEQKLGIHYAFWGNTIMKDNYNPFRNLTNNPKEIEKINMKNLEYLKGYDGQKDWEEVLVLKTLIDQYEQELDKIPDKEYYKTLKLDEIKETVKGKPRKVLNVTHNYINPDFKTAYDNYMLYETKPVFNEEVLSATKLVYQNNGYVLAQFRKYISDKKSIKEKQVSLKQQILILEYIGVLDLFDIATIKKGELFSQLLNRSSKNTEDSIRYVGENLKKNKLKTKENLEFVYKLFTDVGLEDQAKLVKQDLDKLEFE